MFFSSSAIRSRNELRPQSPTHVPDAPDFCFEKMKTPDDAELDRLLSLFDDHAPVIKALLLRIVGDEEEAEDLLTETFAAAWKEVCNFDVEPLSALIEIARERGLGRLQENGGMLGCDECTLMEMLVVDSPLGNLPVMQRRAVEHVFFEGGSVSGFAQQVNAPKEWVSEALGHALSALWKNCENGEIELVGRREIGMV